MLRMEIPTMNKYIKELMNDLYNIYGVEFYADSEHKVIEAIKNGFKKYGIKIKTDCAKAVCECTQICETPNGNSAILPDDAYDACLGVKIT